MALMTNLPPQAYTRDTLVKAIEWLSSQPPSVRERATTADVIVSFYMQAVRRAAAQMEAPVSVENFKADLKHLASSLKEFEEPVAPPIQQSRAPSHGTPVEPLFKPPHDPPRLEAVPRMEFMQVAAAPVVVPQPPPMAIQTPAPAPIYEPPPKAEPKVLTWAVDAKSLALAKEVKERFNLSTEVDALRMLIVMGAQKTKESFPG
jgi:hypothetical protein